VLQGCQLRPFLFEEAKRYQGQSPSPSLSIGHVCAGCPKPQQIWPHSLSIELQCEKQNGLYQEHSSRQHSPFLPQHVIHDTFGSSALTLTWTKVDVVSTAVKTSMNSTRLFIFLTDLANSFMGTSNESL
jgi:hypothetical protein